MTRTTALGIALAGALVIGAVLWAGPPASSGLPLSPSSTDADGLAAMVAVLDELGVPTRVVPASDADSTGADVVVVPSDASLPDTTAEELAAGGATVVVLATTTVAGVPPETTSLPGNFLGPVPLPVDCPVLADVTELSADDWRGLVDVAGPNDRTCVDVDGAPWLVDRDVGAGRLVRLGSAGPFLNGQLQEGQGALALVRLVARGGDVAFVELPLPGEGNATLGELVPSQVWDLVWLASLGFVLAAAAVGRRLGPPVEESLPVRVPGAELVRAVADLRLRARHRGAAARDLRARTLAALRTDLGLTPDDDADVVRAALRSRGVSVRPGTLQGPAPSGDDGLVALAVELRRLRAETAATRDAPSAAAPAAPAPAPGPAPRPDPKKGSE